MKCDCVEGRGGSGGTCAGWCRPEIDAEGRGIMVAPSSTGADAIVVGVAAPWGGKCLAPP